LRLQAAVEKSPKALDSAIKLENIFLRDDQPMSGSEEVEVIDGKKEDDISKNILKFGKNISFLSFTT
jgi:hypothetical protein